MKLKNEWNIRFYELEKEKLINVKEETREESNGTF